MAITATNDMFENSPDSNERYVGKLLDEASMTQVDRARKAIEKLADSDIFSPKDIAAILACENPDVTEELCGSAGKLNERKYGKWINVFATIDLSDGCRLRCSKCPPIDIDTGRVFKPADITATSGLFKTLTDLGHNRVVLTACTMDPSFEFDAMMESIGRINKIRKGDLRLPPVDLNVFPLDNKQLETIAGAEIGACRFDQITYHRRTYDNLRFTGRGANYLDRIAAPEKAVKAGIKNIGMGISFGFHDYRYELLCLLKHIERIKNVYGVSPITINLSRIKNGCADGRASRPLYGVTDDQFRKITALLSLSVPEADLTLVNDEPPETRTKLIKAGIRRLQTGTCAENEKRESSPLNERRNFHNTLLEIMGNGYIPSFCASCYHKGDKRLKFKYTGKRSLIKRFCLSNAVLSFKEYIEEHDMKEARETGDGIIEEIMRDIPSKNWRDATKSRLVRIERGERCLHF